MTAKKIPKRQKLRNAEYYDFQNVQDRLYKQSLNNQNFYKLVDIIVADENIKLAYRNLKKNIGSMTAGVDKKNIKDLAEWNEIDLINHIKRKFEMYTPQPVRRVEIPKGNGKTRPLGIPTIMDRLIQQCILQVLEPICEAKFFDRSNGFRPNRSCETALSQCYKYIQRMGLHYVIDIDIKSFFDNVNHGKLLKQMWHLGIRDKRLICIISAMLKAEVAEVGFPDRGTPQGGIISPLLSNIVLNELDWWVASQWENIPTKIQYKGKISKNGTVDKAVKYSSLRNKTSLKECFIVRYADDFKIFCRNYRDANKIFIATEMWLKERLNLDISPEKSKIVNLKNNYSEFLGFKLKVRKKGKKNNGQTKYVVRSHISEKAKANINRKIDNLIGKMQHASDDKDGYRIVGLYNSYIMGLHNYYCFATNVNEDLDKIAFGVKKSLKARFKKMLKRDGKYLPSYVKERYGKSKELRYLYNTALIPLSYIRHKSPMDKPKVVNKYTPQGRTEIHKKLEKIDLSILYYIMRNPIKSRSIEYNDNRLAVYCAQQGKCKITGLKLEVDEIHCHHKIPFHKGGNDSYFNLIIVHRDIHRLIHANDIDTINRYVRGMNLTPKQIEKVNVLRNLAELGKIIF